MAQVVQGQPIHIEGRELVPLVRVEVNVRRRAFVGANGLAGQGQSIVHMRPVAVVERDGTRERRIPIPDRTGQLLGGLLLAAFIIPLLFIVAVRAARKD